MNTGMRVIAIGYAILIVAIIANALASSLGLATWYDVLSSKDASLTSWAWLVLVYHVLLGATAWCVARAVSGSAR